MPPERASGDESDRPEIEWIMETSFNETGRNIASPEVKTLFSATLARVAEQLAEVVGTDGPSIALSELARSYLALLPPVGEHFRQLATFLRDLGNNPANFQLAVSFVDHNRGVYGAKLRRRVALPITSNLADTQRQLSLFVEDTSPPETEDQARESASLKGVSADVAARRALERRDGRRVILNTVAVLRDPSGRTAVAPFAGIELRMVQEGVRARGVIYAAGAKMAYMDDDSFIVEGITAENFQDLFNVSMQYALTPHNAPRIPSRG